MIAGINETPYFRGAVQEKINQVLLEDCKINNVYDFHYKPENDGFYPCRVDGEPMYLSPIGVAQSSFGVPTEYNDVVLDFHSAKKFFSASTSPEKRRGYYENTLEVRQFTHDDRRYVWSLARQQAEVHLLGQLSVFSKVGIIAGTCIGVYAGEVINDDNESQFTVDQINTYSTQFRICKNAEKAKTAIVGDGMLSRVNGIFEYNQIRGWHEADSGFNACIAGVPAKTNDGADVFLPCVFAISDIVPGQELRVEYGYSDKQINKMMEKYSPKINADKSI